MFYTTLHSVQFFFKLKSNKNYMFEANELEVQKKNVAINLNTLSDLPLG